MCGGFLISNKVKLLLYKDLNHGPKAKKKSGTRPVSKVISKTKTYKDIKYLSPKQIKVVLDPQDLFNLFMKIASLL